MNNPVLRRIKLYLQDRLREKRVPRTYEAQLRREGRRQAYERLLKLVSEVDAQLTTYSDRRKKREMALELSKLATADEIRQLLTDYERRWAGCLTNTASSEAVRRTTRSAS